MFRHLRFELAVGPIAEGDLVDGRWTGVGITRDGDQNAVSAQRRADSKNSATVTAPGSSMPTATSPT